jgi:chromosome segregation ATPase
VIEGVSALKEERQAVIAGIKDQAEALFREYREVEQKERRDAEESVKEILHQLRISGSAIGAINPKVMPEWQQALDRFAEPYITQLEELKEGLKHLS